MCAPSWLPHDGTHGKRARGSTAMIHFEGSATARVAAPAPVVFDLITDVDRLPTWNDAIERVVEMDAQDPGQEVATLKLPAEKRQ